MHGNRLIPKIYQVLGQSRENISQQSTSYYYFGSLQLRKASHFYYVFHLCMWISEQIFYHNMTRHHSRVSNLLSITVHLKMPQARFVFPVILCWNCTICLIFGWILKGVAIFSLAPWLMMAPGAQMTDTLTLNLKKNIFKLTPKNKTFTHYMKKPLFNQKTFSSLCEKRFTSHSIRARAAESCHSIWECGSEWPHSATFGRILWQ